MRITAATTQVRQERPRPLRFLDPEGHLVAASGNIVDYGAIERRILADAAHLQIKEIA
jgi:hypothetical protein